MIEKILSLLGIGFLFCLYIFKLGKDSVKNVENENVVENVKRKNEIIEDFDRLSNDELSKRVSKWKNINSRK